MKENKKIVKLDEFDEYVLSLNDKKNRFNGMKNYNYSSYLRNCEIKFWFISYKKSYLNYFLKRMAFSIAAFFVCISLVFLTFRLAIGDSFFLKGATIDSEHQIILSDSIKQKILDYRLKNFSLNGSILHQFVMFWYNITPFFKKVINVNNVFNIEGEPISTHLVTQYVYLGLLLSSVNGFNTGDITIKVFNSSILTTVSYGLSSLVVAYIIGTLIGIIPLLRGKNIKTRKNIFIVIYSLIPQFITVILFYWVFKFVFKFGGVYSPTSFLSKVSPWITLVFMEVSFITVITRSFIADELRYKYHINLDNKRIKISKGLIVNIYRGISLKFLKNLPYILLTTLFAYETYVEYYWEVPGIGNLFISGIKGDSYFLIQTYLIIFILATIILSTFSDSIYNAVEFKKFRFRRN